MASTSLHDTLKKVCKFQTTSLQIDFLMSHTAHTLFVAKCAGLSQCVSEAPDFSQMQKAGSKVLTFQIQYSLKTKKQYPFNFSQFKLKLISQSKAYKL